MFNKCHYIRYLLFNKCLNDEVLTRRQKLFTLHEETEV